MLTLKNASIAKRIENAHLSIGKGECWHVLGNNGAGKSSLLSLSAGILVPDAGHVDLFGRAIQDWSIVELAQHRCFLQQLPLAEFDISLGELLAFYTQQTTLPARLEEALCVQSLMHLPLTQLSGGQQQRFHLARSLTQIWQNIEQGSALIILDEPCQHLDVKYQTHLMRLLSELVERGNSVLMSSHDINQSQCYASHVVWVKEQAILSSGSADSQVSLGLLEQVFEHTFMSINSPVHKYPLYVAN